MKISMVIGMCALLGAAASGCSGAAPTSGYSALGSGSGTAGEASGSSSSDQNGMGTSGSPGEESSGSAAAVPSSGGPSSGSDSDSGTSGDEGGLMTGDAASQDNPEVDYTQTKTITMAPFNVPANTEVFYCQTFANPWGKQVDIKTYDLTMDEGSHHMFAFYKANATNGASAACASGGLTFGPFTFTSQTPTAVQTYPETVGATLPQTSGFNMMAHYLNTTTGALTAHVSVTMYVAKPGAVTNHAGVIFLNNVTMSVPVTAQPVVSTASMKLNQDVNIMFASSHMHKFGTNFIATGTPPGAPAQTIYTTKQWDEPKPNTFATPLHFPSGTNFTWSCTDVNTTGSTLTFGEYAQTNVMCIAVDIFYPVQDITNPVLGSAIGGF